MEATIGLIFYGDSAFIKKTFLCGGTEKVSSPTFTDSVSCKLELTLSAGWVVALHSLPALLL